VPADGVRSGAGLRSPRSILHIRRNHGRGGAPHASYSWTRVSSDPTFFSTLVHKSTNTGLGSTTSAPRGGDIENRGAGRQKPGQQAKWACENQRSGKEVY